MKTLSNRKLVWIRRKRKTCYDCWGFQPASDRRRWSISSNWLQTGSLHSGLLLRPLRRSIDLMENTDCLFVTYFFLIHLSSIPLASFPFSLFHPAPLLLSSFHSANHSFLLSPSPLLLLSSSSTYFTMRDPSQAFKTDGWWWMVRQNQISLPLCLFLPPFLPFFHMVLTLFSLMHFWS